MTIKFGTDGWRTVISDTFTFSNLRLVAQAIADYVLDEAGDGPPEVVIGFDTRFLSDRYATEVARVLAGNGIIAHLTRADAPTPAISYAVVHKKANAADHMLKGDVLIGGEESGGLSIKGHIPEGDGVLMRLLLVEIVVAADAPLHELVADLQADVGPAHYVRHDIPLCFPIAKEAMVARLTGHVPDSLGGQEVVEVVTLDGVKYLLADDSWLLIRPSGTEPVLRVYAEARSSEGVQSLLEFGESVAAGGGTLVNW